MVKKVEGLDGLLVVAMCWEKGLGLEVMGIHWPKLAEKLGLKEVTNVGLDLVEDSISGSCILLLSPKLGP